MTEYQKFVALVADMRSVQKKYFKYRTDALLNDCKALERRVDAAILDRKKDAGQQQGALL